MTTEQQQLPSMIEIERHRTESYRRAMSGACAELTRVQEERDALHAAVERAVAALRAGRNDAALVILEGTLR